MKSLCLAHIIPDLLYKPIRDKENILKEFDQKGLRTNKLVNRSNGMFDKHILCKEFDNLININYEKPYLNNIHIKIKKNLSNEKVKYNEIPFKLSHYLKIDCTLYHKFLLSILWRSSISHKDHSSLVDIDKSWNDQLKFMLKNKDIPCQEIFPILIFRNNDSNFNPYIISEPVKNYTPSGIPIYKYLVGNLIYFFFIPTDNQKIENMIIINSFMPGSVKIIELPDGIGETFIKDQLR